MKKLRLLFISLCLFLAGCSTIQNTSASNSVIPGTNTVIIEPTKKDFPVEAITEYYTDKLKENVSIPVYSIKDPAAYFEFGANSNTGQFRIYVNNTIEAEFISYIAELTNCGWYTINSSTSDLALQYKKTRAVVDFYKALDYEEEPYIVIVFSTCAITYDALQIMKDVVISMWGFVEEGIILEPDESGIIRSTRDIIWDLKDFTDDEEHTRDEYLRKALRDLLALSVNGYFPGYLFYDWYHTPTYDEEKDIAEVYLGTYNLKYVLYMFSYYEGEQVKINFMAGPDIAFPHAFKNGD